MSAPAPSTWPSDDPDVLGRQLLTQIDQLKNGDAAAAAHCRAYLEYAMASVWRAFARGEIGAPRAQLERFRRVVYFVQSHMPALTEVQAVATEIGGALQSLHLAAEVAEELGDESKILTGKLSDNLTTQNILAILHASGSDFLRRGQVHESLSSYAAGSARQVSKARVGQILDQLYEAGLVQRTRQPGRGGLVSYYRVSERGSQLAAKVRGRHPRLHAQSTVQLPVIRYERRIAAPTGDRASGF